MKYKTTVNNIEIELTKEQIKELILTLHVDYIELGVFRTREEAELARDKQRAIVACWKWAQENAPFEPDWENKHEDKYYTDYCFESKKIDWEITSKIKTQFILPYFESPQDCLNFIKANKANLELLFTK